MSTRLHQIHNNFRKTFSIRQTKFKAFLSQVTICVSEHHYTYVMRLVMSLQWIYKKIRQDYDVLTNRIHFLNIINLKYNLEKMTQALTQTRQWVLD